MPPGGRVTHRDTCRLCESRDLALAVPLAPTPVADDYVTADQVAERQETYPLDLHLCLQCGHVQLLDAVDPELLFRNYTYVTSVSLGLVEHFRRQADDILAETAPPAGALAVELGSNDGTLLRFFKDRGLRVVGVDPAREIARAATASGIETIPAFFTAELGRTLRRERGPAAIVAANNVFAHADDLGGMADGVRELLAPDGIFVFEVSYLADIVAKMLFDTVYHEHLSYHSVKPLEAFFRRHRMELIDVIRIATKGGSIRGIAQQAGGPRRVASSIPELLALEAHLGLDRPEPFAAFAEQISQRKAELLDFLGRAREDRKTIAGYGASATVTTLMYQFELGERLDFLVDDNPLKHHTFSPGYHLPVLPPQALADRRADFVVVLAWNYAEPIVRKQQAFLARGGHFVVPLPALRVV